jgi:hypothetical protein
MGNTPGGRGACRADQRGSARRRLALPG